MAWREKGFQDVPDSSERIIQQELGETVCEVGERLQVLVCWATGVQQQPPRSCQLTAEKVQSRHLWAAAGGQPEWRKAWVCATQWRKVKQMQPVWLCLLSGRWFEETFKNTQSAASSLSYSQEMFFCREFPENRSSWREEKEKIARGVWNKSWKGFCFSLNGSSTFPKKYVYDKRWGESSNVLGWVVLGDRLLWRGEAAAAITHIHKGAFTYFVVAPPFAFTFIQTLLKPS